MNKLQNILLAFALPLSLIACSEQEPTTPAATQQAASQASGGGVAPNKGLDYDSYVANIEPIFLKHGGGFVGTDTSCVTCHTTQANAPLGLQALTEENGVAFWTEEQSRQNFENVVMLVNPSAPESSRLLLAPLASTAGGDRHSGGNFWNSTDHPDYRTIANWIAAGDPNAGADPIVELDFDFFRNCVQPIFVNPIDNAMPCIECHAGEFAIPPPPNSYWTVDQSRLSFESLSYLIDPGRPESSRFLHKPLHPDAGGDLMHNGGRRWFTADDPERLAIAEWVRGNARGDQCPAPLQYPNPARP